MLFFRFNASPKELFVGSDCLWVCLTFMASKANTLKIEYRIFKYPDKIYQEDKDLASKQYITLDLQY